MFSATVLLNNGNARAMCSVRAMGDSANVVVAFEDKTLRGLEVAVGLSLVEIYEQEGNLCLPW